MKQDILLDENLQLKEDATTHDLMEGESTGQHQQLLLLTPKGSWKEAPDCGVGLMNYLEDESPVAMYQEIAKQFRADGMDVKEIKTENGKLLINANYKA